MKKSSCSACFFTFTCSVLLTLSFTGCGTPAQTLAAAEKSPSSESAAASSEPESTLSPEDTALLEPLVSSYYEGQSSRAFRMLQKSIFQHLVDDWTDESVKNPVWNYDTFSRYEILDRDPAAAASKTESGLGTESGYGTDPTQETDPDRKTELYCCTYSADHGKSGYMVLSYDGDSLSKLGTFETPYLYDLQANIDTVLDLLDETNLDQTTVSASRVRLTGSDGNSFKESIRITDAEGHCYFYCFADASLLPGLAGE